MDDFWNCEFYTPLPRNLLTNSTPAEQKIAVQKLSRPPVKGVHSEMERPNLKWLTVAGADGKKSEVCFRTFGAASNPEKVQDEVKQRQFYSEMLEDDDDDLNGTFYNVIEDSSNKFVCNLTLPCDLFGCIIGPRGSIKNSIEGASKTKIMIPQRSNDTMGKIVIRGNSRGDVEVACRKIYHIVQTNRNSIRPTHFVGIPVEAGSIRESFEQFKRTCSLESIFLQSTVKLHFTLGMLILLNEDEVAAAARIVEDFVGEVLRSKYPKLKLKVKGLEIMQDDPSMARVLYGDVVKDEGHDEVQNFGKELISRLDNAGFLKKSKYSSDHIKLHMTVANAKYAERKNPAGKNSKGQQDRGGNSMDVTTVLEKFGKYDFGEMIIDSLSVCEMQSATDEHGYKKTQHFLDPKKANPSYLSCGNNQ